MPAKAGIHTRFTQPPMDPRLRGDDSQQTSHPTTLHRIQRHLLLLAPQPNRPQLPRPAARPLTGSRSCTTPDSSRLTPRSLHLACIRAAVFITSPE